MTNSLIVSLSPAADAVRLTQTVRILRGVENVDVLADATVAHLRDAIRGLEALKGIDLKFLQAAATSGHVLREARARSPELVGKSAQACGATTDELDRACQESFAHQAMEAARIMGTLAALAPDLLKRWQSPQS